MAACSNSNTLTVPEIYEEESVPFLQNESQMTTESTENVKAWDAFQEALDDTSSIEPSIAFKRLVQIFKAVVYLVTFCAVLGTAVVSKGTLLFMTSLISNSSFKICHQFTGLEDDKSYVVRMSNEERRGWIWSLIIALMVPELFTFIRSCRICIFKTYKKPQLRSFITVLISESLHVVGLALMVLVVFPHVNVIKGLALTCAVSFVPSVMKVTFKPHCDSTLKAVLDIAAVLCQASGLILWPILDSSSLELWAIPVSLLFISCGWWENFVDKDSSLLPSFVDIKKDLEKSRHFTYVIISLWKVALFLSVCLCICFFKGENVQEMFTSFLDGFKSQPVTVYWEPIEYKKIPDRFKPDAQIVRTGLKTDAMAPVYLALIHVASSYLCYSFGKFGCKIGIQEFSYALPISLAVPATMVFVVLACDTKIKSTCSYSDMSPYIFWNCPKEDFVQFFILKEYGFVWIFWILSQAWITIHIWSPKCERLASTYKLFVNPMYCSAFIDQCLALNRRVDEDNIKTQSENEFRNLYESTIHQNMYCIEPSDTVPRIYACATMWHETTDEMELLLKSVFRMDADQCARKNAAIYLRVSDPDFYYLEAHIFFDDAFVISDEDDEKMVINCFVKDIIKAVDSAACKVHETQDKFLSPPIKVPTPYGGRLVWRLPGGNNLVVHLKNKELIRHKKRWSQCMYMYYLLGHRLMNEQMPVARKSVIAENTYILALDGDIDFKPDAVQLLVDLMNRNKALGAACGRIHPVGTGMMVYYQKFEYAIGHWLQKATEHMIGCVLCSPGCFSLFRAKALMDDNVVRRYTTKSKDAINYVQFDQGEDRWLCTLLLQRGYRVEYSAASDAYTHCPETFAEFYTQRRRWAPSTMANIMDLLVNYKKTVAINDNISMAYIAYQVLLMIGTILGPGTIFLMLVGAMVSAFGISNWQSFAANIFPVALFILICFFAKNDSQILVAQIFSAAYALLMMAVLVGIALQLVVDGITSPSAIFLLSLTSSFVIAAVLHPQEFWCVAHGLLYFLSVPSMYLLLALYSIVNLNVVSWGTREVQTKKSKKQMEAEKAQQQQEVVVKQDQNNGVFGWFNGLSRKGLHIGEVAGGEVTEEGGVSFGLANLFRCMCCTYPKTSRESLHLEKIGEELDAITKQICVLQKQIDCTAHRGLGFRRRSSIHGLPRENLDPVEEAEVPEDLYDEGSEAAEEEEHTYNQPDHNEHWLTDPAVSHCQEERLEDKETIFWTELIDTYLYPLNDDPDEKAKAAKQLLELRNKVVFGFLMLNSLFILIVFLLQMQKDTLHVNWPLSSIANITYLPDLNEVVIDVEKLQLEPINLILAFFFTLILVIQFVAMLLHRLETMSHILASTDLDFCCCKGPEDVGGDENINKNAVQIAQVLQQLKEEDSTLKNVVSNRAVERRNTIQLLDERLNKKTPFKSLSAAFAERYKSLSDNTRLHPDTPVLKKLRRLSKNPETIEALKRRATTHRSLASSRSTSNYNSTNSWQLRRLEAAFGSTPGGSVRSTFSTSSRFFSNSSTRTNLGAGTSRGELTGSQQSLCSKGFVNMAFEGEAGSVENIPMTFLDIGSPSGRPLARVGSATSSRDSRQMVAKTDSSNSC